MQYYYLKIVTISLISHFLFLITVYWKAMLALIDICHFLFQYINSIRKIKDVLKSGT